LSLVWWQAVCRSHIANRFFGSQFNLNSHDSSALIQVQEEWMPLSVEGFARCLSIWTFDAKVF